MNCDEAGELLHAYLDDELDVATALQVETHLTACSPCQKELDAARAVSHAAAQPAVYFAAPSALRDRLRRDIRAESGQKQDSRQPAITCGWRTRRATAFALAAMVLLAVALVLTMLHSTSARGPVDEVLASHLRSLEASHLLDVDSTDQHTVKPWFAGKLEFSPPVIDLAAAGFPLIGGRLDYLSQRKVAALIYRHDKHVINIFIWPGEEPALVESRQGFNFIRFNCRGMVCWAVSDLNVAELKRFAELFEAQKSPSTRS